MATLIDALTVSLGLDASQFTKGAKDVQESFKKTREDATKGGKEIETAMKAADEGVRKLLTGFLGLFAVLSGGKALKDFIADTTKMDAATGRAAANMNLSAQTLKSWQGVVGSVGGTADEATQSFQGLSDTLNNLKVTGQSPILPYLQRLFAGGGMNLDMTKSLDKVWLDIAKNAQAMAKVDPSMTNFLLRQIGASQALANALMQGPEALQKLIARQKELTNLTEADVEAAKERVAMWNDLGEAVESYVRKLQTLITGPLNAVGNWLTQYFVDLRNANAELPRDFEILGNLLKELWKNIGTAFKIAISNISTEWKQFWGGGASDTVKGWGGWIQKYIPDIFNNIFRSIKNGFNSIWQTAFGHPLFEGETGGAGPIGAGSGGGGLIGSASAAESGGRQTGGGREAPGTTPWNRQTGGPPAALTKPYGDKMPSYEEFQKSLSAKPTGGPISSGDLTTEQFLAGIKGGEGVSYSGYSSTGAIGAYGLTGGFIKEWAPGAGLPSDRESYKNNKELQDKIANYAASRMYQRYGSWKAVANAWLTGSSTATTSSPGNMSPAAYDAKVLRTARSYANRQANPPPIEARQDGGPVSAGQPYVVGERGPETFVPNESGHIARSNILSGKQDTWRNETRLRNAFQIWENAIRSHILQLKDARRRELFKRQGESNYGASADPFGFQESPERRIPDKGIVPGHHYGGGHGEQDPAWRPHGRPGENNTMPNESQRYWWGMGGRAPFMNRASLAGAGLAASNYSTTNHHGPVNSHNNSSSDVHVGAVHVNMPAGSDASAIARDIKPALERTSFAMHANYSLA